ncbi:hypothetical protein [[Mycoplasma] testudinis]|uniref:hypothetical protein n=1 Tax=[Mycoplasma] testudinis TaxID=33924 RepID=UPI0004860EE7|nr:hypothetical protein [[Mycoplasma] testudinis]
MKNRRTKIWLGSILGVSFPVIGAVVAACSQAQLVFSEKTLPPLPEDQSAANFYSQLGTSGYLVSSNNSDSLASSLNNPENFAALGALLSDAKKLPDVPSGYNVLVLQRNFDDVKGDLSFHLVLSKNDGEQFQYFNRVGQSVTLINAGQTITITGFKTQVDIAKDFFASVKANYQVVRSNNTTPVAEIRDDATQADAAIDLNLNTSLSKFNSYVSQADALSVPVGLEVELSATDNSETNDNGILSLTIAVIRINQNQKEYFNPETNMFQIDQVSKSFTLSGLKTNANEASAIISYFTTGIGVATTTRQTKVNPPSPTTIVNLESFNDVVSTRDAVSLRRDLQRLYTLTAAYIPNSWTGTEAKVGFDLVKKSNPTIKYDATTGLPLVDQTKNSLVMTYTGFAAAPTPS